MRPALVIFGNTCAAFLAVAGVVQGLNWLEVQPTAPVLMAGAVLVFLATSLVQSKGV